MQVRKGTIERGGEWEALSKILIKANSPYQNENYISYSHNCNFPITFIIGLSYKTALSKIKYKHPGCAKTSFIIKITASMVTIHKTEAVEKYENNTMTGHALPVKDSFTEAPPAESIFYWAGGTYKDRTESPH